MNAARRPPHVVLIGLRGSGKSSIGRAIAASSGRPFIDLDDRVLASFDEPSVEGVFAARGESAWRARETVALRQALAETIPSVLALGGGTPTAPGAAELLRASRRDGALVIVHLDPSVDVLIERLAAEPGDRPSLTGAAIHEEVRTVRAARHQLFASLADLTLGPSELDRAPDAATIAATILGRIEDRRTDRAE